MRSAKDIYEGHVIFENSANEYDKLLKKCDISELLKKMKANYDDEKFLSAITEATKSHPECILEAKVYMG